ncbi:MAG: P-loop NTPase [bacterium]|nr:P-loop NTPase [bacterium]
MGKARFAEATYDPAFKGAPWANQITDTEGPKGLVIAVAAAKGGAGKSTLTCWLSEAFTASGVSVALVDANIGQPDIAKMTRTWLQSPGIAALTGERRFSDEELFEASLHIDGLGRVLGGPAKPLEEAPESMLAALALATERLAAHHEFVIVDTPVGTVYEPVFGRFVLHVANILLVVTNPHEPTVQDTAMWINDISRPPEEGGFGWPLDKTLGVLNRADHSAELNLENVRSWIPNLNTLCDVPEVKGVIAAVNSGEWRCPKTARDAVAGLAHQLCQTHPSLSDPLAQSRKDPALARNTKRQGGLLSRLRRR